MITKNRFQIRRRTVRFIMSSSKDINKKVNAVRKRFGELTNVANEADQSTNQSVLTSQFKSFAHIETSSEEICDSIEAFMNANCSKYAVNKTIQKLCSSNSSKEIDLTLNHLSMMEVGRPCSSVASSLVYQLFRLSHA